MNRGIRCPFSSLPNEPVENTCEKTAYTGNLYFLPLVELYDLVTYGELLKISTFRVRCSDTGIKDLYEFLADEMKVTSEADVVAHLPEVAAKQAEAAVFQVCTALPGETRALRVSPRSP